MTQEIIKIVGIEVKMPYHDEAYIVGEKPVGRGRWFNSRKRCHLYKNGKKWNNTGIIHKSTRIENNLGGRINGNNAWRCKRRDKKNKI